jgi:hypothetical protein
LAEFSLGVLGAGTMGSGIALTGLQAGLPVVAIVAAGEGEGGLTQAKRFDRDLPGEVPLLCQMADVTWSAAAQAVEHPQRLIGFDGLFFVEGRAVSLVADPQTSNAI